jgi:hypothetical protein
MNATPMNPEQQRRAERRTRIERWNGPEIERRIDVAERAALAAFPVDRLAPALGVIERVITFKTAPQSYFQPRLAPWAALCIAGNRRDAAIAMQRLHPEADFDDDLWRAIEATQPVTEDKGAVERVVAFFVALTRTRIITFPREAEFTARATRFAEESRLRMGERIAAARAGFDGLRLIQIDDQWWRIQDPVGMELVWERLGRTAQATAAKARKRGPSLNPVMDTDESERARNLAEERSDTAVGEGSARDAAIWQVRKAATSTAGWRTRDYIVSAEKSAREHFERQPEAARKKILRDTVLVLHRLLSPPFSCSGLSVRPQDLLSGVHVSDILRLFGQWPRLWRLIVQEGVTTGVLWFEEADGFGVVLASRRWRPGNLFDPFDPSEPEAKREIDACLAAMEAPYPETLPDSPWLKSGY